VTDTSSDDAASDDNASDDTGQTPKPMIEFARIDGDFAWSGEAALDRPAEAFRADLEAAVDAVRADGGGRVQLWLPAVDDAEDALVGELGFTPYRDLWQLRCPLPSRGTDTPTRPFEDADAEEFLEVNNAAFSWHPEQGGMTLDGLAERQAEPWYDPEGFLIHTRQGRIAGFNWTKEHPDADPPMGEIYAIAVHPDFHGLGLGRGLTLAGLAHLHSKGFEVGMLYVESDNVAANRTYDGVGFRYHHANRAYELTI